MKTEHEKIVEENQRLEKLELLALKKVVTRLRSSILEYRKKHSEILEKRRLEYEKMSEYASEEDAQEAYGWGIITEKEFDAIKERLRSDEPMLDQTSEFEMAANILSDVSSPMSELIRTLEYNAKTDEEKGSKDSWAGNFFIDYPNDLIDTYIGYRFIQKGFG